MSVGWIRCKNEFEGSIQLVHEGDQGRKNGGPVLYRIFL